VLRKIASKVIVSQMKLVYVREEDGAKLYIACIMVLYVKPNSLQGGLL
jgi:hypothetical protein